MATAKKAAKKPAAKKPAAKKTAAKKPAAKKSRGEEGPPRRRPPRRNPPPKKPAAKRKPNAAFMKAMTPSSALAAVVGAMPMPRTEVTKKIWDYIKKNKLQDAMNRRLINADDKLKRRLRRQGQGLDVRDDQAGLEPPQVTGTRISRATDARRRPVRPSGTPAASFQGPLAGAGFNDCRCAG